MPRYPSRNNPAWYRRLSGPLFTSAPSAAMEMALAEERHMQWLAPDTEHCENLAEATCCCCFVYSRVDERLRNAYAGYDVNNTRYQAYFNFQCLKFLCGLPCKNSSLFPPLDIDRASVPLPGLVG